MQTTRGVEVFTNEFVENLTHIIIDQKNFLLDMSYRYCITVFNDKRLSYKKKNWRLACWFKFSADDILKYCFQFFPENRIWHFIQIVSIGVDFIMLHLAVSRRSFELVLLFFPESTVQAEETTDNWRMSHTSSPLKNGNNLQSNRYLEVQRTLWNISRYPYLSISDLQDWESNIIYIIG